MSQLSLWRASHRGCAFGIAALLVGSAGSATADPAATSATTSSAAPPPVIRTAQRQHERWIKAFNGWRAAKATWAGETPREAELRRDTRLSILPTSVPLMGARRRIDGSTIVVSSGLFALVDELLIAETARSRGADSSCLVAYGNGALETIKLTRGALSRAPAGTLTAWPRLTRQIDSGTQASECRTLTPPELRNVARNARIDLAGDALMLWLFSWQQLRLASLPAQHPPASTAEAAQSAPLAKERAASVAADCHASVAIGIEARASAVGECLRHPAPRAAHWLLKHYEHIALPEDIVVRP